MLRAVLVVLFILSAAIGLGACPAAVPIDDPGDGGDGDAPADGGDDEDAGSPVGDGDGDGEPPVDAGAEQADGGDPVDEDGWRSLPSIEAGPRQEIAVLALEREVFVVAGYSGATFGDSLLAFDVDTETWREAASLPTAVHHPNATVWGGKIFVLGYLGSGFGAVGAGWVYDPVDDAWTPVAAMPVGRQRGAAVTVATDDAIWVLGGYRSGALAEVSTYDPVDDTWTPGPDLPEDLDHAFGAAHEGTLIVTGGRDGAITALSDTTYRLAPGAEAWVEGAPMPTARGGGAFALSEGVLVTLGGEGNLLDPSGVFGEVELYDVAADSWSSAPAMPTPRHGMGAAAIDGVIYVPGGAEVQAFGATDHFDAWRLP